MRYRIASTTGRRADLYFPYTTLATITEPKSLPNSLNITCDDTVPCGTDLPVTKGRPVRGNREGGKDDVRESECDTV